MSITVEVDPDESDPRERAPRAICFGGRRVPVVGVLDRWYGRQHTWWKLQTDEGAYVLVHDESRWTWDLAAVVAETGGPSLPAPGRVQ